MASLFDFGVYTVHVLWSYAATTVLITALIAWILWRNARVLRELRAIEKTAPRKSPTRATAASAEAPAQ